MRHTILLHCIVLISLLSSCQNSNVVDIATQINSSSGTEKLDQAGAEFQQGNYAKAIALFNEVISEKDPATIYQANYNKAYCYYKMYDFITAKEALAVVLEIEKSHAEYAWFRYSSYYMLGRIASKEGQAQSAVAYFEKAILYQQTRDIYNTIAFEEARLGKYESALEHADLALAYDERTADIYSTKAWILLGLHETDKAKAAVEEAIRLDSLNPYAFKHRAMINIALKKIKSACEDLNRSNALQYRKYSDIQDANEVDSLLTMYCD